MENWEYRNTTVGTIRSLLEDYEIEVDSPDGWIEITDFIDKGNYDEYILISKAGKYVRCNHNHLFETSVGWMAAGDIAELNGIDVLHEDGIFSHSYVIKTGKNIPIVDITVNHPNHRYFTNGVSSHNTGGGKSLVKCHMAAAALALGKNVLYVTMELAEERVAQRIDANLMGIHIAELKKMERETFDKRIKRIRDKTVGKLIIKEYPTVTANAAHIRHLLNELRLKKNFVPDIIFLDYLNIMTSVRIRGQAAANSYTLVKSIAEEVRGLAMEFNVPIVSSSQYNRAGLTSTDVDMTNVSESVGLLYTCDLVLAIITTPELEEMGQIMFKQLKNRFGDLSYKTRFVVGIKRSNMVLYNLEDGAQKNIQNEPRALPESDKFADFKKRRKFEVSEGVLS